MTPTTRTSTAQPACKTVTRQAATHTDGRLTAAKALSSATYDTAERVLRFGSANDDPGRAAARMTLRLGAANNEANAAMVAARSALTASSAQ